MRNDLTSGLVIRNYTRRRRIDTHPNRLAIDLYRIPELNTLADVGRFCIDRNPALQNQLLHLKTGAQPRLSEHFVQLRRFGLRRQYPLRRRKGYVLFISIKLPRHHVFKSYGADCGRGNLSLGRPR